jgi:hypothetical protein
VKSQGATKNYWGLPIEILENLKLILWMDEPLRKIRPCKG